MIRDALIIIPNFSDEDQVCDFLYQTASRLAKNNKVIVPIFDPNFVPSHDNHGISFVTFREILPLRRFTIIRRLNRIIFILVLQLSLSIKYPAYKKKFLWMFFPELADLVKIKIPGWKIIFDIVDFHFSPSKRVMTKLTKQKENVLKNADYIFCISRTLKKLYQPLINKKIKVVPQGFDFEAFTNGFSKKVQGLPNDKPIIGFVGQMSERLDFNLLLTVIENNPQWNFVFVGPRHFEVNASLKPQDKKIKSLTKKNNFYWLGRRPRSEILALLERFDVCIIPYDCSLPFNKYSYPMKIFEYFYAGKKIVSTPIEEFKKFVPVIKIASSSSDFTTAIQGALMRPYSSKIKHKMRHLSLLNTWENKLDKISQSL